MRLTFIAAAVLCLFLGMYGMAAHEFRGPVFIVLAIVFAAYALKMKR